MSETFFVTCSPSWQRWKGAFAEDMPDLPSLRLSRMQGYMVYFCGVIHYNAVIFSAHISLG